jgi:hypothetical protein
MPAKAGIQYAEPVVTITGSAAYWIIRFRG